MSNLITTITNIELPSNHYLNSENIYRYLVQELTKDLNPQDKENYLEFLDGIFFMILFVIKNIIITNITDLTIKVMILVSALMNSLQNMAMLITKILLL